MSQNEVVEVSGTYIHDTDKGLCLEVEGEEIWWPKSQVDVRDGRFEKDQIVTMLTPKWLAEDKGLA